MTLTETPLPYFRSTISSSLPSGPRPIASAVPNNGSDRPFKAIVCSTANQDE